MINIENKKYWNIVKGIGIFSIVVGHSWKLLVPFVYMFHLVIFFFLGGYFYNEEKYGDNPYKYFVSKLKTNWTKYIIYSLFFILLHNILLKYGLIINVDSYHVSDFVSSIINSLLFFGTETLSGALWFVPVYIFASTLFGVIVYFSKKKISTFQELKYLTVDLLIGILSIICGIIGVYLIIRNKYLMLHVQTSFLVVPFYALGYYLKKHIKDLNKILKIIPFIISLIVLLLITYKTNYRINLTDNVIGNFVIFYFISFVGIYFCLYISKFVLKILILKKYFNLLGTYSFEIMAFHFFVIKIIDVIYSLPKILNGTITSSLYGIFPYAYENLWPYYILFGTLIPALFFYFFDKKIDCKVKEMFKNYKKFKHKNYIIILIILLCICVSIPILKLGIMHNDELMSRFWSSQGFVAFYKHYFIEQIEKGRALSSFIIPITMYLGFIGQDTITFKFFQIISILLCLFSMNNLLKRIFKDKKHLILYSLIFLSFMQISFEPTVPNVFVTFYNISICLLLYSLSLFIDYLDTNNNKKIILSMIIFFIVELTYESFITYIPLYLLIVIYKKGLKNLFKSIKLVIIPIGVGVVYLVLYVLSSKIFPSNYIGNQIGTINIINSFKIIFTIGYYSLPGSYTTSDKYLYLLKHYFNYNTFDLVRIIIFAILFIIIFVSSVKSKSNNNKNIRLVYVLKILFASILSIILPIIPISVATMYQSMDIGKVTLGLPVSFFSYFGSVLLLTIIVIYISSNFKYGKYFMLIILLVTSIEVQTMNSIFSREANKDFKRIQLIERFITSGIFDNLNNKKIYTNDLFITKNALYVHDTHWNDFAKYHNINVSFINDIGRDNDIRLYLYDELSTFELTFDSRRYLISENDLNNDYSTCITLSNDFKIDNNWHLYELKYNYLKKCHIFNMNEN